MTKTRSKISLDFKYMFPDPPTPVFFWNHAERKHFIVGNQGGTSSSKTYSICQVLPLRGCEEPGQVITVVGQDIPNMKKGVIRDFNSVRYDSTFFETIIANYNKTDRLATLHNGSIIEFTSYENWQDAKSGKRDYLFINEANGIDWEIAKQLILRTKKQVFIDFNADEEFWYHKELKPREDCITYYSNFTHNQYCPETTRKEILRLKDTNWNNWQVYGLGKTGKPTNNNPAWYGFSEDRNVSSSSVFQTGVNVHCSFDQNLRPYVSQICAHIVEVESNHYELQIFDEVASKPPKNQVAENCREFKRRYPGDQIGAFVYYYGDASLHVGSTLVKAGVTGFSQISNEYKGYTKHDSDRTHKSNPPIVLRTEFVNTLLKGEQAGGLKLDVKIHPDCEHLITDLKFQKQGPDGKPVKERVKGEDGVSFELYGHMADALVYLITSAFSYWWNNFLKDR